MDRLLKHRIFGLIIGSLMTFVFLGFIMTQFPNYLNLIILIGMAIGWIVALSVGVLCVIAFIIAGINYLWKRFKKEKV